MDAVLSVRQLTDRLRASLEQKFPYVWVRGEITNLSRPSSGHVYFSLKEGDALLACVWFRGQQAPPAFDPLTGEVYEDGPRPNPVLALENGRDMICAGRLGMYPPRSSYQLLVDLAQEAGLGQWHLAFEALKAKLAALGYFEQARKRPIPYSPARVALITAPTGAALRDFVRVASERGLGSRIRIYPSPVQGEEAPQRLTAALREANAQSWAELIVLARGGGSLQDLHAFNDEGLARAIFESRLPVLTGVGHEIDHSIADFVADKSAATPSHAAQMLWPERREYMQAVDELEAQMRGAAQRGLALTAARLDSLSRSLGLLSPRARLRLQDDGLRVLAGRLAAAGQSRLLHAASRAEHAAERLRPLGTGLIARQSHALDRLSLSLEAFNPLAPLDRGYALLRRTLSPECLVHSVDEVHEHDTLEIELKDGRIDALTLRARRHGGELSCG